MWDPCGSLVGLLPEQAVGIKKKIKKIKKGNCKIRRLKLWLSCTGLREEGGPGVGKGGSN